jgi:hypothetical protein
VKKKVFALVSALVLTFGMTVSVFAQTSPDAGSVSATSTATVDQTITQTWLDNKAATVKSDTATISAVKEETAKAAQEATKSQIGSSAVIDAIIDVVVPGGGEATITLTGLGVKAGQKVSILHQKADGSWEKIAPDSVGAGSVTFKMTSYSPVAVVVEETTTTAVTSTSAAAAATTATVATVGTAPKTGDIIMLVTALAVACLAGTVVFSKKATL